MAEEDKKQGAGAEDIQNQSQFNELLFKSSAEQEKINELLKQRSMILGNQNDLFKSQTETQNAIATDLLNRIDDRTRKEEQLTQQINAQKAAYQDIKDQVAKISVEEDKNDKAVADRLKKLNEELNLKNQSIKLLKDERGEIEDINKFINKNLKDNKELQGLLDIKVDGENTLLKILKDAKTEEEKREAILKARGINRDFLSLQQKVSGVTGNIARSLGMSAKFSDTRLGKTVEISAQMFQQIKAGKGMAAALGTGVLQLVDFRNLFGSILDKVIDVAIEIDKTAKGIQAATGFTQNFNNQVMNVARNTAGAGASVAEAGKAIQALSTGFSAFSPANKEVNVALATTVVRLEKIGVNAAESVKALDFFTRVMGMSASVSNDMTVELAQMGQQMGVTSSKMVSDFLAVSSTIVVYGNRSMDVFKDLAAQAKATGLEISTLVKVAAQFDEFDKAANSIAQLNAVLGTQMSTVDMLSMDEGQRLQVLRQQVNMSVGSLNVQDKFTQKFIAQAIGVQDVNEAMRLLNMNQQEYLAHQNDMAAANKTQEDLANLSKQIVPLIDQFKITLMELALAFGPVIEFVLNFVQNLVMAAKFVITFGGLLDGSSGLQFTLLSLVSVLIMGKNAMIAFGLATKAALGPVGLLITAAAGLYAVFTMAGSPKFYEMGSHIANNFDKMGDAAAGVGQKMNSALKPVQNTQKELASAFHGLEGIAGLNAEKLANDLTKVRSVLLDMAGSKIDGFLAIRTDGTATSLVMGSESVMKNINEGKIQVDVNLPEIAVPNVEVKVYLDSTEFERMVKKVSVGNG